jgi:glyoxylase-like metal-dependent hydrolase (beta-lactamase superfamily II)
VLAENPGPFTYLGTGTYLIGHSEVAVVDPGPLDEAHVERVIAALEPGERITHIVVTHTHGDHSPASLPLQKRTGAITYGFGPQRVVPDLAAMADDAIVFGDPEADGNPLDDLPLKNDGTPQAMPGLGADQSFEPDVVLRDGDVVGGDGWTLDSVYTPGHASNHLCYVLREESTLFSGDHVMGWSTTVVSPADGDLGEYLDNLEKLFEREQDRRYLPTHGPPIEEPHVLVRAFLTHRNERSEQLLDALDAGPATIAELVPRVYALTNKKLWRGAAGSMYAQLLYLRDAGEVEVEVEALGRHSTWVRRRS